MALLKTIVDELAKQAENNRNRAYQILGAEPGPGLDLLIRPVEPLCGKWIVEGLTKAGKNFISKFWFDQPIRSNQHLSQLRREADDWNLKYKTEYPILSLED